MWQKWWWMSEKLLVGKQEVGLGEVWKQITQYGMIIQMHWQSFSIVSLTIAEKNVTKNCDGGSQILKHTQTENSILLWPMTYGDKGFNIMLKLSTENNRQKYSGWTWIMNKGIQTVTFALFVHCHLLIMWIKYQEKLFTF